MVWVCKKTLLKSHLTEHTGSDSDAFFLTLLQDQAKAFNISSRQNEMASFGLEVVSSYSFKVPLIRVFKTSKWQNSFRL